MNLWTMSEVAAATGGTATGDGAIMRVVINSREVQPGDLFVALAGERFDGHDYVAQALERGATAALVHRPLAGLDLRAPLVTVEDTFVALYALARAARARARATLVGVTGSVGKTGAKEALKLCLAPSGETFATAGNRNNHIGLPLSLANLAATARFGVFELGMNHAGEISPLSTLLRPHVALITNVEAVHLEFFADVGEIADAKAELFDGMAAGGIAVLPSSSPHFARLSAKAEEKNLRIFSFGTDENADYRILSCRLDAAGTEALAHLRGTPVTLRLGALGAHWGVMAAAVLAGAEAAGADLPKAAEALQRFREPVGRGRVSLIKWTHGEVTLIDDSYNASPASMKAAFEKLRAIRESAPSGILRTVAVLGDMLELGADSEELHVGLVPSLVNNQIDLVFAAGQMMKRMFDTLPESMKGAYARDAETLSPQVTRALRARDLVLVKGSNGSRMQDVVRAIEDASGEGEAADAL